MIFCFCLVLISCRKDEKDNVVPFHPVQSCPSFFQFNYGTNASQYIGDNEFEADAQSISSRKFVPYRAGTAGCEAPAYQYNLLLKLPRDSSQLGNLNNLIGKNYAEEL